MHPVPCHQCDLGALRAVWSFAISACALPVMHMQAATRLLYNISRAGEVARRAIKQAGGVQSILKVGASSSPAAHLILLCLLCGPRRALV